MSVFRTQKAIERLQDSVRDLTSAIGELESANKRISLEWEELYDKVRRQMARMSKRYAVDAKENGQLPPEDVATDDDSVDPISAKILARRGFMRRQAE